jgi:hypothetical protein
VLIVGHPWLGIDNRLRNQRQGIPFIGELEFLASSDSQLVVPEVQLVAQIAVEAVQAT